MPSSSGAIKWISIPHPAYVNTTNTIPNMVGNRITYKSGSEGDEILDYRRLKPIPITLIPLLSPAIQDSLTPSIG